MKILSILNISNKDDMTCDSGVIFQRILSSEFVLKGIEYIIIGPPVESFEKLEFKNVRKIYVDLGTTRYSSRFNFNWDQFKKVIIEEEPDVIFNNQVELSTGLRALLVELQNNHTKIVTYCHYPAIWSVHEGIPQLDQSLNHNNLCLPIVFDILSSLITSDKFVIQSKFAKKLINDTAKYYNVKNFPDIEIIAPPIDPSIIYEESKLIPKNRNLLYNHRLYESYGTSEFLEFIDQIKDLEFKLIVSDPMPNRSDNRSTLNHSPALYRKKISNSDFAELIEGNVDRKIYSNIIKNSRISFAALRKACVWSMAAVDCMSLGIPVLAPNYASYPEFIPSGLLYNNVKEAKDMVNLLLNDDDVWLKYSQKAYNSSLNYSPKIIAKKFINIFKN